jgi:hypothetical protein
MTKAIKNGWTALYAENEHLKKSNMEAQISIISAMREIEKLRQQRDAWRELAITGGVNG